MRIDRSRLTTLPSLSHRFRELNLMITTKNKKPARRHVEFDDTRNDADRRGKKMAPALNRAITKFLNEVADCCIARSRIGAAENSERLLE